MESQNSENNPVENKSTGLFSIPAALIKKLYSSVDQDSSHEEDHANVSEELEEKDSQELIQISKSMVDMISDSQYIFGSDQGFETVKKLASEIKDLSDSNHVLIAFTNILRKIEKSYLVEKHERVFNLPLEILSKFKFSQRYQEKCLALQKQCKKVKSIEELNSCLQAIYELFCNVYQDTYADKEELENFLFNIGAQINRIGEKLHTVAEEQACDLKIQGDLNIKMDRAVNLISKNINNGNDLSSLKKTVKEQLDILQNIVEEERQIVKEQEKRVNNNVKILANRVNELTKEAQDLRNKVEREKEQALRDPLTGLYNRQAYNEKIAALIDNSNYHKNKLCLIIWDIDHFKNFNDQYGHVVGDKVLKAVADKLIQSLKQKFFLARFGGEEFAMLLPETSVDSAKQFAENVREEISKITFLVKNQKVQITISCGIALLYEKDNAQSLFEHADKALYQSKEAGRNAVSIYQSTNC